MARPIRHPLVKRFDSLDGALSINIVLAKCDEYTESLWVESCISKSHSVRFVSRHVLFVPFSASLAIDRCRFGFFNDN